MKSLEQFLNEQRRASKMELYFVTYDLRIEEDEKGNAENRDDDYKALKYVLGKVDESDNEELRIVNEMKDYAGEELLEVSKKIIEMNELNSRGIIHKINSHLLLNEYDEVLERYGRACEQLDGCYVALSCYLVLSDKQDSNALLNTIIERTEEYAEKPFIREDDDLVVTKIDYADICLHGTTKKDVETWLKSKGFSQPWWG